jgi:hypothetical protein
MAIQLERPSSGGDVIHLRHHRHDPEAAEFISDNELVVQRVASQLRGFEEERFQLWRVGCSPTEAPVRTETV